MSRKSEWVENSAPYRYNSDGRFDVLVLESFDGFNLNKGQNQPLAFTRLTLKESAVAGRTGEQTTVK